MGRLADLYDRLAVTVRSPDRTVQLTVTGRGGVSVELAPDIARRHTEESLERQLNAVARVGIAALQQGQKQAYVKATSEDDA